MILFVSVGNTRVKLAYQDHVSLMSCSCNVDMIGSDFESLLATFLQNCDMVTKVVYCSVVDKANKYLLDCLAGLNVELVLVDFAKVLQVDYQKYPQLGNDRKMVCEAVVATHSSAIVIDLGTATTVNVFVDKVFVGGLIMPGIEMSYHALTDRTSKIDVTKIVQTEILLGLDTLSNVSSGIINMTTLSLNSLIDKIRDEYEYDFSVYITGGNACYILKGLDFNFTYDEDLLIKGMLQFA